MMEEGEQRFTRLSADSVRLCADNVGVQTTPEVSNALVDDVSFRIRQITDTATQFMRHAKRRRLMVEDFNKAVKWSGIEPLYGHQSSDPPQFSPVHQTGLFSVDDPEVRLEEIAHGTPVESHTLPQPPSITASWLSVEGVPLPQDCSDPPEHVELKRDSNESEHPYMSLLMEAITGENEDMRRIALNDIQHNTAVANILADLFQYLQETLGVWSKFTPAQLVRVLKLLLAILRNSSLFLDPYVAAVYPSIKATLLNASYLTTGDGTHWNMRQAAALTMAELLHRCGSPLNDHQSDLLASFHQLLTRASPPLPVLYGVVMTLCYSGGKNISEVLLPCMDTITTHIQGLLECGQPSVKDDALRVYETLLLAAELFLTSDIQLASEQLPPSLSRDSPPTRPHPPGGETSLFGNTSFGLSGAQSSMEEDGEELAGQKEVTTLYDYLMDLFGERLSLRLVGHLTDKTLHSSVKPLSTQNQAKDPYHHSRGNRSLILFLSQEGFKPVKVDLPHRVVPPRIPPGQYIGRQPCTFSIPRSVLPVRGNALESHKKRHRTERPAPPPVVKGRGYGRKKDGGQSVDISSSWI